MANYSTKELPKYGSHQCPSCKAKISSYEGDAASYVACVSCNTFYSLDKGTLTIIKKFSRPAALVLPIGTKGIYKNKKYQVVAALHVKESNAAYYWMEYVLKCDDGTYDFISEYEGHWSFVHSLDEIKLEKKPTFFYKDREYTYFNYYKIAYVGVAGEFTWDVTKANKPTVREYISPPYGLNNEVGALGNHWYETEYLTKSQVKKIFNLSADHKFPYKSGPYSTEPFPLGIEGYDIKRTSILFVIAMLATVFLCMAINNPRQVYWEVVPIKSVYVNSDTNNFVSEPFVTSSLLGTTALDVFLSADVYNSWLEGSFSLINDKTGEEFFFEEGVEFYAGYEGGEHWTEGSTENTITLSEVPDGKYRMIIKPMFQAPTTVKNFKVSVTEGVNLWSNFFITTALGLIIPLLLGLWEYVFTSNKWGTSNLIEHG